MSTLRPEFRALAKRSGQHTAAAIEALTFILVAMVRRCTGPEHTLGLVQALLRTAAEVSFSTRGSHLDVLLRSPEEFGRLAEAHWRASASLNSAVAAVLREEGVPIPQSLQAAIASGCTAKPEDADDTGLRDFTAGVVDGTRQRLEEQKRQAQTPEDARASFAEMYKRLNSRGGVS